MNKCDIIIPVWNELESTKECINRLKESTSYPYRLIVIDNGSLKPTGDYLESLKTVFPELLLIKNSVNLGFVKAVNQGIVSSDSPHICILNNDAYVTQDWLTLLMDAVLSGPGNIGMANPTSNVFGRDSADGEKYEWQELDCCKGFCMLIKREVVDRIGLFDEIYGMGYFEEKDFSRRAIEAGYICIRSKASFVFHKDRLSFGKIEGRDEIFTKNEAIYNKRWGRPLNIAFMVKKKDDLKGGQSLIYELLRRGHCVNIFSTKREYLDGLKDHIQIRFIRAGNLLFENQVLFKLWERLRKKRIEIIVTKEKSTKKFFDMFKFVHRADVPDSYDEVVRLCEIKSRQGRDW
ncbi:MAG: hypothetical protein A2Z72_02985 [Omnitrophica bacterium RBG_13_46_9]|nr:MAG: hypothetical protein A2Z72_02985 [Omnitrophica bacterium RBG_13_46_9]